MNPVSNMLTIQLNSPQNTEIDKSLRSQQMLVARLAQNGFMSRDQQARLSVSSKEMASLKSSSLQLLGGVQIPLDIRENYYNLETDQMIEFDYRNPLRISILVAQGTVHVTVTKLSDAIDNAESEVIFDGDCAHNQKFAKLAENLVGKIKISIKNNTQATSMGFLKGYFKINKASF